MRTIEVVLNGTSHEENVHELRLLTVSPMPAMQSDRDGNESKDFR